MKITNTGPDPRPDAAGARPSVGTEAVAVVWRPACGSVEMSPTQLPNAATRPGDCGGASEGMQKNISA